MEKYLEEETSARISDFQVSSKRDGWYGQWFTMYIFNKHSLSSLFRCLFCSDPFGIDNMVIKYNVYTLKKSHLYIYGCCPRDFEGQLLNKES